MIHVAIVEDDVELLNQLKELIQLQEGFACEYVYENGTSAIKGLANHAVDVVLMDINLPDVNGVQCVESLVQENFPGRILMYTVFDNSEDVIAALKAGAIGYILKRASFSELLEAITDAYNGGSPMTANIARKVVSYFHQLPSKLESPKEDLTKREQDILQLLAKGFSNQAIADKEGISVQTVKVHLRNIYQKWQINSRAQAVHAFYQNQKL